MTTLLEALRELKEELDFLELPFDEKTYEEKKARLQELRNILKTNAMSYDEEMPLLAEQKSLRNDISKYEYIRDYNNCLKDEHVATEEEWDNYYSEVPISDELSYDDLDVEVTGDFDDERWYQDTSGDWNQSSNSYSLTGYIYYWVYSYEYDKYLIDDTCKYLKKQKSEVTNLDLAKIILNAEDFEDFLKDEYRDAAEEDAEENYEDDDVSWNDPEDYYD